MGKTLERRRLGRIFRKYLRLGLYKRELDVFSVCALIRGSCISAESAKDVFAAWATSRILMGEGKEEHLRAFLEIYALYDQRYARGTEAAVLRYTMRHHYDARSVYRRLTYVERVYRCVREQL